MIRKFLILLYQPYKWLIYLPFLVINTLIFAFLAFIFSVIINPRVGSYIGGVLWSKLNTFLVPVLVKVEGRENLKPETSYIVLTNHQSAFDIFLIYGWLGLDIKWVMKKNSERFPELDLQVKKWDIFFWIGRTAGLLLKVLIWPGKN